MNKRPRLGEDTRRGGSFTERAPLVILGDMRQKLTVEEQIDVMKRHGVLFEDCDENKAADFLTYNTYFFKLKVFENNFRKTEDGLYDGLDFAHLVDLSTIDYRLRALLSSLCLNIEHAMKARFNRLLMDDPNEDGYQIVREFDPERKYVFTGYNNERGGVYHYSPYSEEMVDKFCREPAAWNLWEVVSFSDLQAMYDCYIQKRGLRDNATTFNKSVRILRNAASHSSCLLIGLRREKGKEINPTSYFMTCLSEIGKILQYEDASIGKLKSAVRKYPLVHDYACTLMSFLVMVDSQGIRKSIGKSIQEFSDRFELKYQYSQMKQCPALRDISWGMRYASELAARYIDEHASDFKGNRILHTQPQPIGLRPNKARAAQMRQMAQGNQSAKERT
ncbi:Abi-like protein [Bifidobacterium pseudolongum subsp. globosum]|uniref:Abi-like protein n=2 Tax=Bifidobacterium pseudolongum TaxID=1694 RepID=A0A4Q5AUG2_9BIFI|nr:Abi-like protein [Bifidobacterium pseudolongum subsp. globosum]